MSEAKRTPGRWVAIRDHPDTKDVCYIRPEGTDRWSEIATLYGKDTDPDANFIIKAVNCHDDLLEAIKDLRDAYTGKSEPIDAWIKADAAIAKAEE